MNGRVELNFGSGRHAFRLTLGGIEELQDKTGVGPAELYRRLMDGTWRATDATHVIRLGLVGAGMAPGEAFAEVRRYCFPERPLLEALPVAQAILLAALAGVPDDPPGKPAAAAETQSQTSESPSPEAAGASPTSTASAWPASASMLEPPDL